MRTFLIRIVCTGLVGFLVYNSPVCAQSFSQKFDEIKKSATKDQLYALLYDLPKGGDLHHHNGLSYFAETWFDGATDMRRTRGNQFYARTKVNNCAGDTEPLLLFRTIQRSSYMKLSDCKKGEYQRLSEGGSTNFSGIPMRNLQSKTGCCESMRQRSHSSRRSTKTLPGGKR